MIDYILTLSLIIDIGTLSFSEAACIGQGGLWRLRLVLEERLDLGRGRSEPCPRPRKGSGGGRDKSPAEADLSNTLRLLDAGLGLRQSITCFIFT